MAPRPLPVARAHFGAEFGFGFPIGFGGVFVALAGVGLAFETPCIVVVLDIVVGVSGRLHGMVPFGCSSW